MKRSVFPSVAITLALLGLFSTATATDRRDRYAGVTLGVEAPDMELEPEYALGVRTASGAPAGWNAPLGATTASTPTEARALGVDWLVKHQHGDGGWGAGSWGSDNLQAPSDVATTCYATLALWRDANGTQKNRDSIEKGVTFVVNAVKTAPEGPRLNTPQGTQPQYKMGELVDTHFAALLLGEVDGKLSPGLNREVAIWYDMVLSKVQMTQNANGSFEANGWAPVLSSSIAAQSLYTAKMKGKDISEEVLDRSDAYQAGLAGGGSGSFDASEGAGVELYAVASGLRGNDQTRKREKAAGSPTSEAAQVADASTEAAVTRVAADADGRLVAGFGSIGGEEMLSYQLISDTLAENGGEHWDQWNQRMGQYLVNIQNADGSWAGHHCITSTVFTTAGAVMTLGAGDAAVARAARADTSGNGSADASSPR